MGTRKEGRLLSIGDVEYGLSDQQGNLVAATIDIEISDIPGRPIGTRLESVTSRYFARDEINVLCISDAGRRAGLAPRNVGRALLQDETYGTPAVAKFQGLDPFFCDVGGFGPDKKFPSWPIPTYYVNAPADVYARMLAVILGEVSDEGAKDPATNLPSARGLCPLTFVGMDGLGTGVDGAAEEWGRFSLCLFAVYRILALYGSNLGGGLYGRANATSDGADPSVITLGGSPDLSEVATDGSAVITLYTETGRLTSQITAVDDTAKTVTIANTIAAADATSVDWVIGEEPPHRISIDIAARNGVDVMVPGYANYIRTTPYEDIMGSDGEVYRVTDIWIRGPLLDDVLSGAVTLAANVIGVEDQGDGTGLPITDFFTAFNWWLENCVLVNSKEPGIQTGYGARHVYPQTDGDLAAMGNVFADGVAKVRGSSFVAAQALSATKIGGRGYQISAYFGEGGTSMRDTVQLWNDNGGCRLGINEWGQIFVWLLDEMEDPETWPRVEHVSRIFGDVIRTNPKDEIENVVQGTCDWDPDQERYRNPLVTHVSADGVLHNKRVRKPSKLIDGKLTRDPEQWNNVLQRRLRLGADAPVYVELTGDIGLLDYPVGSGIRLTSIMGPGALGYVDQPAVILKKRFKINSRLMTLTCLDVGAGSGTDLLVPPGSQFILHNGIDAAILHDDPDGLELTA